LKIFITGSTGYIGRQLAVKALAQGYEVSALVRRGSSLSIPQQSLLSVHQGDVTDLPSVVAAMKDCDFVFHAAALTQLWHKDASLFYRINVEGTKNILEAALQTGVKKVVFTSSCAVLGPSHAEPVKEDDKRLVPFENDYEISKHQAESLIKDFTARGLQVVVVRPPRVFGPGLLTKGNPINRLIKNTLARGIAFMPAAKDVLGNYAYIDDVVQGHFLALEKGRPGEAYNIGGENISYQTLFSTIATAANKKIRTVAIPIPLLKAWASLVFGANFLIGRHTHISPKIIDRLMQNRAVSCEKAVRELGYRITPFHQAVLATVHHLKEGESLN
jgi:nucleoside-diphosphate-sugar epimerase